MPPLFDHEQFKRDFDNFDKDFDKVQKLTRRTAIVSGILLLIVIGVLVWAVIRLVLHFT